MREPVPGRGEAGSMWPGEPTLDGGTLPADGSQDDDGDRQPWLDYLSDRDLEVLTRTGDGELAAELRPDYLGTRPVVLAIDLQAHLFGEDVPILESVEGYRTSMGAYAWGVLDDLQSLLGSARDAAVPVIYTRVVPGPASGLGPDDIEIVDAVAPEPGEPVLDKSYSSAFYGTDLLSRLVRAGVDTVVIIGCSTGGCVRATAVDAAQLGFDVVVPVECTFDRVQAVRAMTLFDLERRHGRVVPRRAVETYFESLEPPTP